MLYCRLGTSMASLQCEREGVIQDEITLRTVCHSENMHEAV